MTQRSRRSDPLREALSALAAAEAPELLAEARLAARARARSLIEDALVEELLQAAGRLPGEPSRSDVVPPAPPPAEAEPRFSATPAKTADTPAPAEEPTASEAETPTSAETQGAATSEAEAPIAPEAGDIWWAYCVLDAADRDAAPVGFAGVDPSGPVEVIAEGDLVAVVSEVPRSDYSDDRLREHLNDVEWVERVARAHESVLERALENATVLPLRLCTLYSDRDGVAAMLHEQGPLLRKALESLQGRREWGVKLFVNPDRLAEVAEADAGTAAGGGSSGAAYMARRQQERQIGARARELGDTAAQEVHTQLERLAEAARSNPPQRPEVHGRDSQMLLNGAYLVAREREHEFEEAIASLREQWEESGFELELTGPWPPYNFVSGSALVMP